MILLLAMLTPVPPLIIGGLAIYPEAALFGARGTEAKMFPGRLNLGGCGCAGGGGLGGR